MDSKERIQNTLNHKSTDKVVIEIHIYSGVDGKFLYYEDEGNNYNYEKGAYNTIDFEWNNVQKILKIGESTGNFNGFNEVKIFNIFLFNKDGSITKRKIEYEGNEVIVNINRS